MVSFASYFSVRVSRCVCELLRDCDLFHVCELFRLRVSICTIASNGVVDFFCGGEFLSTSAICAMCVSAARSMCNGAMGVCKTGMR